MQSVVDVNDDAITKYAAQWSTALGVEGNCTGCCQHPRDEPCLLHSQLISDTPTVAKAYASLPAPLYFQQNEGRPGVFARTAIRHPSVFGPVVAALAGHSTIDQRFGLRDRHGGLVAFDLQCDDRCNWIKFVRPVDEDEQPNLVAFCRQGAVFLATTAHIPPGVELCFGYSQQYARMLGKENHSPATSFAHDDFVLDNDSNAMEDCETFNNNAENTAADCSVVDMAAHLPDNTNQADADNVPDAETERMKRTTKRIENRKWSMEEVRCLRRWVEDPDNAEKWISAADSARQTRKQYGGTKRISASPSAAAKKTKNPKKKMSRNAHVGVVSALDAAGNDLAQKSRSPSDFQGPTFTSEAIEAGVSGDGTETMRADDTAICDTPSHAKSAERKRDQPYRRWTEAEGTWLVEWLDNVDNYARWQSAGKIGASADLRGKNVWKTDFVKDIAACLAEQFGGDVRSVSSVFCKIDALEDDWKRANEYLQRTEARRITLAEAWRMKRHLSGDLDGPYTSVNAVGGRLHPVLDAAAKKTLHHRIWPCQQADTARSKTRTQCRRAGCALRFHFPITKSLHALRHQKSALRAEWDTNQHPIICPECDYRAVNWTSLVDHVEERHQLGQPRLLPHRNKQPSKTTRHSETFVSCRECKICDLQFVTRATRNLHCRQHEETEDDIEGNTRQCPACMFSAVSLKELIAHVDERHVRKDLHKCPRCGRTFVSLERLESHIQRLHLWSDADKPYECPTCHKRFSKKNAHARHLKFHLGRFHMNCMFCNEKFDQTKLLHAHVLQDHSTDGVTVTCGTCNQKVNISAATSFRSFQTHVRRHGEGGQTCTICGKEFANYTLWYRHTKESHGAAPRNLVCDCGKAFSSKRSLCNHRRLVHKEEREIPAHRRKKSQPEGSGQGSGEKEKRAAYVPPQKLKHYTEFPYFCEECRQGFVRRGMMAYHFSVRHPERSLEAVPQLVMSTCTLPLQ
ncbi:uncharacterized protein LOC129600237 [Paramacrobiotus metropolitanus]|uniref:uncharacterized protein LOC129600237 n=1 Tax=Paramacrobiotus metropolitanus TaxID=2943436 RepID=UPI002445B6BB|nr:uncharacterized protein LOC129600237 [Paramacrobiotus metropolitanus]